MHWLNKLVTVATKERSVKSINVHTSEYVCKIITNRQRSDLYRTFVGRMNKRGTGTSHWYKLEFMNGDLRKILVYTNGDLRYTHIGRRYKV